MVDLFRSFPITPTLLNEARVIKDSMPDVMYKSIEDGEGTLAGSIGEAIFLRITGGTKVTGELQYQYQAAFVSDQELNLVACLTELMAECEFA